MKINPYSSKGNARKFKVYAEVFGARFRVAAAQGFAASADAGGGQSKIMHAAPQLVSRR